MYKYKIWCRNCLGDRYGCFDGGVFIDDDEDFLTYEEADKAGDEAICWGTTWQYEVIKCQHD